jgi:hypothetical protein
LVKDLVRAEVIDDGAGDREKTFQVLTTDSTRYDPDHAMVMIMMMITYLTSKRGTDIASSRPCLRLQCGLQLSLFLPCDPRRFFKAANKDEAQQWVNAINNTVKTKHMHKRDTLTGARHPCKTRLTHGPEAAEPALPYARGLMDIGVILYRALVPE